MVQIEDIDHISFDFDVLLSYKAVDYQLDFQLDSDDLGLDDPDFDSDDRKELLVLALDLSHMIAEESFD